MGAGTPYAEWGLDPRYEWWETYNPSDIYGEGTTEWPWKEAAGGGGGGGGTAGGGEGVWDWSDIWSQHPEYDWSQGWMEGGEMEPTQFNYPQEYHAGSNVLQNLAQGAEAGIPKVWSQMAGFLPDVMKQGLPTDIPWAWSQAQQYINELAKGEGMPTSQDPWYQQAKTVAQQDIEDAIKQASEQAGLAGLRFSTPLGRSAQEIAAQRMGEVGLEWTGRELDALEAARARQQEAYNQLLGLGQGVAGLGESAAGRQMQALGLMQGLGGGLAGLEEAGLDRQLQAANSLLPYANAYLQWPQDWSQQMYEMGAGMTSLQQQAMDRAYQDWLRTTPEASTWLANAMGYAGLDSAMAPTQYQQSTLSQLLSSIPGLGVGAWGLGQLCK
jgi:hypothetical protein